MQMLHGQTRAIWLPPRHRERRDASTAAASDALIDKNFVLRFARGMNEAFMSAHADDQSQPEHCVRLNTNATPYV
jgi:hypothetical protein